MKLAITMLAPVFLLGLAAAAPAKAAPTCTVGPAHFNFSELHCIGTKLDGTGWLIRYNDTGGGTAGVAAPKHICRYPTVFTFKFPGRWSGKFPT